MCHWLLVIDISSGTLCLAAGQRDDCSAGWSCSLGLLFDRPTRGVLVPATLWVLIPFVIGFQVGLFFLNPLQWNHGPFLLKLGCSDSWHDSRLWRGLPHPSQYSPAFTPPNGNSARCLFDLSESASASFLLPPRTTSSYWAFCHFMISHSHTRINQREVRIPYPRGGPPPIYLYKLCWRLSSRGRCSLRWTLAGISKRSPVERYR